MHIYLITHAHTEQDSKVASDQWRLSTRGEADAASLARAPFWQEVEQVVVSSESKTWLTVRNVVEARHLPVWFDARFDELRRGGWVDNYAAQVAAAFATPTASVGEWEPVESVAQRAAAGLTDLEERFRTKTIALVGHGLCLSIVRTLVLDMPKVDFVAWQRLTFGSYACITWTPPALLQDFAYAAEVMR